MGQEKNLQLYPAEWLTLKKIIELVMPVIEKNFFRMSGTEIKKSAARKLFNVAIGYFYETIDLSSDKLANGRTPSISDKTFEFFCNNIEQCYKEIGNQTLADYVSKEVFFYDWKKGIKERFDTKKLVLDTPFNSSTLSAIEEPLFQGTPLDGLIKFIILATQRFACLIPLHKKNGVEFNCKAYDAVTKQIYNCVGCRVGKNININLICDHSIELHFMLYFKTDKQGRLLGTILVGEDYEGEKHFETTNIDLLTSAIIDIDKDAYSEYTGIVKDKILTEKSTVTGLRIELMEGDSTLRAKLELKS